MLESRQSPLCAAVERGHYTVAAALLAHGARTQALDLRGDTPLHHAARGGDPELVRLLLDAGALTAVCDASGNQPRDLAADAELAALLAPPPARSVDAGLEQLQAERSSHLQHSDSRASLGQNSDDEGDDRETEAVVPAAASAAAREGGAAVYRDTAAPSYPSLPHGEPATSAEQLSARQLVAELQQLLKSDETEPKRLLTLPKGIGTEEVQCDVMRTSVSPMVYRCFLRLGGVQARRICILEATRSRKGKLKSSHYHITLFHDPRLLPAGGDAYCGKMRSKSLSGANFVCYDDGHKPGQVGQRTAGSQPRRQLAAVVFSKASSRRAPMSMRVLAPSTELAGTAGTVGLELLDTLQALGADGGGLPGGTELLRLVPPRWNEQGQMYQLSYEGRACCMSNKNVQLANVANERSPTLQVGKLQKNLFNMDFGGCLSPFQAFAISLSIFEQSSVRRRF
eukprot:Transcript_22756.p1 GENE.Transcript_22756~~Transcript_22756.p1  ORF type:complete len:455 (+),score=191.70 Transcript_22756:403-1767(+)